MSTPPIVRVALRGDLQHYHLAYGAGVTLCGKAGTSLLAVRGKCCEQCRDRYRNSRSSAAYVRVRDLQQEGNITHLQVGFRESRTLCGRDIWAGGTASTDDESLCGACLMAAERTG